MGRSIFFGLTMLGLIGLLTWKSREVPRFRALSRSTASESAPLPSHKAQMIHDAKFIPEPVQDEDGEVSLKTKTSLVIEPVSPDEDRKLQRRGSSGKLTEFERVQ